MQVRRTGNVIAFRWIKSRNGQMEMCWKTSPVAEGAVPRFAAPANSNADVQEAA